MVHPTTAVFTTSDSDWLMVRIVGRLPEVAASTQVLP